MGLFTNNKKLCPICGNPTPRLLATKVEDVPLCKECASKIDLPDGDYVMVFEMRDALDNSVHSDPVVFTCSDGEIFTSVA